MVDGEIRDRHCTKCALSSTCKSVCIEGRGGGNHIGGLMIVGEMPSWSDDEKDAVFTAGAAQLVPGIIKDVIEGDSKIVYSTYLVKCATPARRKATDQEVKACRYYLEKEIMMYKPKMILALGDIAMEQVSGQKKVASVRGKRFKVSFGKGEEKFDTSVIGTYSPFYVDKVQAKLPEMAGDILKAYNFAAGIAEAGSTQIVVCDTFEKVKQAVEYCKQVGICSFDFETPEIDENKGTFLEGFCATSLSLSFQAGSAYVIPLEHFESPFTKKEVQEIMDYLKVEIFQNRHVRKIGQNVSYDMHICRIYGIEWFRGRFDDTLLMHHLYDETKKHGLKEMVAEFMPEYAGYEDDIKGYKWTEIPLVLQVKYNGCDTDLTLRLATILESILQQDERVYKIYRNLTMAVHQALWQAEARGMLIDEPYLRESIKEVEKLIKMQEQRLKLHPTVVQYIAAKEESTQDRAIEELEEKLAKYVGCHKAGTKTETGYREKLQQLKSGQLKVYEGFNFGSWQQLEDMLYDSEYGFRFVTFTRGTAKEVLEDLNDDSGFVELLLLLRTLEKMYSTYLVGVWNRMDRMKRVHTQILLQGTVSGRLSSRNPNLQNLPNIAKLKDEVAIRVVGMIKKCFKPSEGTRMLQRDYSQAELRIIADFARERTMLDAYEKDLDLHSLTGSKVMDLTLEAFLLLPDKDKKEGRTRAKAGNFGLIYGMGVWGFIKYAKNNYKVVMQESEGERFRDVFFETYPKLLDYHDEQIAKARKYGWVRTLYGRKRRTPDIHSDNDYKRSEEERIAINSPVQGTAGEFTIFSIALLQHRLHSTVKLDITVHDSILYDVPVTDGEGIWEDTVRMTKKTCEHLPNRQYFNVELEEVKMKVDGEWSDESWKDLTPLTVDNF